jgi:AcrR family transcriptional regulator
MGGGGGGAAGFPQPASSIARVASAPLVWSAVRQRFAEMLGVFVVKVFAIEASFCPNLLSLLIRMQTCMVKNVHACIFTSVTDAATMKRDSKNSEKIMRERFEQETGKQKRALLTRQQLIKSARATFAKVGFENTRIEDIASNADKTRGAFYANFKDKEDVFFAIFEEELDHDIQKIRPLLQKVSTLADRLHALARYLCYLGKDRQRTLLNLEFKLYAIRHPARRKRLADLYSLMRLRCSLPEIDELLPEYQRRNKQRRAESLAVGGVMDGLAINQLFDPGLMKDQDTIRYLELCLWEKLQAVTGDFTLGRK